MNYSKEIRDRPMIPNSSSNGNSYASGSDEYANSAYFRFNIEVTSARIDESHMPEHLRHHQWTMDRVLGEGSRTKTYLALSNDGMVFAVRKKRRQDSSTVAYERDENSQFELAMDTKLEMNMDEEYNQLIGHHPNIVNIIGFRRVGLCWEQFVEYIDGENFYNYMDALYFKTNRLIEGDKARSFFTNLMNAVEHIHSLKLAHMDIKLEHCLITRNGILKLSNFAEARIFVPNLKFAFPEYFTKAYAAPETLKKKYRPDVADIWACGIFLYVMLKKCFPWDIARKNEDRNYRRWVKNDDKIAFLSIPGCYGCVSDLLVNMLQVKPSERATATYIKNHRWFSEQS